MVSTNQHPSHITWRDVHLTLGFVSPGGLPIFGRLYDEAIPCYEELTGSDETERFIPKSCEHLFAAFHLLNSKKEGEDLRVLASD